MIAYDGFDSSEYTVGVDLDGQGFGTGWGSVWDNSDTVNDPDGIRPSSTTFTYTDGKGESLANLPGSAAQVSAERVDMYYREIALPGGGAAGSEYWISLLVDASSLTQGWQVTLSQSTTQQNQGAGFGNVNAGSDNGVSAMFRGIQTGYGSEALMETTGYNFLVARIEVPLADSVNVSLWLNPDLDDDLTSITPDSVSSGAFFISEAQYLVVYSHQSNGLGIDELRVGTTMQDVMVAIPEPSTYAMFAGISVLGLMFIRRRVSNRS
ncbi:PEP-CTERM sorting domain-containing protein [Cerasicoccus frondis]|uniref:PEP-CTERM sorting domain-containing protein n=1 Tax=Cerasicoccus frondis TaxID=490090 RepID=UPI002852A4DB|nr:PEP-CTERM sorting domain-containing protein [Cerasicoccus frondis]